MEGDVDTAEDYDLKSELSTYPPVRSCLVTLDKGVPARLEGATQPHTQFQGTDTEGRRRSDYTRQQEKQGTPKNWDFPSAFTWERRHH